MQLIVLTQSKYDAMQELKEGPDFARGFITAREG